MTAPLKPWERAGVNSRAFGGDLVASTLPPSAPNILSGSGGSSQVQGVPGSSNTAPPLPPRVPNASVDPYGTAVANAGYSPYGAGVSSYSSPYNSYGGYGSGGYGGYGGSYSGFGGGYGGSYGSGYGGYSSFGAYGRPAYGANPENRFVAAAEESSRPAFQSLESIVQAFGSISMMLDSTLNAVYSSFRAVLGMADQFSRLRSHLGKVFSALAIFRTAKWAYYRLLYLLGLRRENPNNMAWNTALSGSEALASGADLLTEADIKKTRSSWPITLFLAIIISAPYFIWRIISSLDSPASNGQDKKWADGEGEHFTAVANYDFTAGSEQELSFRTGQTLRLAPRGLQPRVRGWILASTDRQHIGLVPANYIRILAKHEGASVAQSQTGSINTSH